jgi:8-oxo-dGTP diphosphatase
MEERRFGIGVLISIFNKDLSKILLIKRNEEKRNKNKADWGSVGGRVDLGEKLLDACIREAREEIGIALNPEKLRLIHIKETPYLTDIFHAIHFIYATILDETENIIINHESEEYRWFNLDELPNSTLDTKEDLLKLNTLAKKEFPKDG